MWNALLTLPLLLAQDLDGERERLYEQLQAVDRMSPVVAVVRAVTPSVVSIRTEHTRRVNTFWGARNQTLTGAGSGVVVHSDGYIVTNYHVVKGAPDKILVSFDGDPVPYRAELVSFVQREDLALLRVVERPQRRRGSSPIGVSLRPASGPIYGPSGEGFLPVRMGTSADLMAGETVIAIGNPFGQAHTVSTGIIAGLFRNVPIPEEGLEFEGLIQTDASINLGNSGGPLLNVRGELNGINTAMNSQAENIGFAIPVDTVAEVLNDVLYPQGRSSWLGFDLTSESLIVGRVWNDGPAALAGICIGDRVLALNGKGVRNQEEFLHATLELEPRERVRLTVERNGVRESADVDSWDRLDGLLFERLGMTVREEQFGNGTFVVVERVSEGSPAEGLGLRKGDLIPAIRPRLGRGVGALRIRDRKSLARVVSQLDSGVMIDIDVYRDENRDDRYSRDELYKGNFKVR